MTKRVEIRPPTAQRIYTVAFGIFWCGVVTVAPHSAASVLLLIMLAFGGTISYRMFRLAAIADEMMALDVTRRPALFGSGRAKLEGYLAVLREWLRTAVP